jgi:hypothetical protein
LNNLVKLKKIGVDTIVISPIFLQLEKRISDECDFIFYTKENPILNWPERGFCHWFKNTSPSGRVTSLVTYLFDYGWAALYQTKKLIQIGLTFDYDIFYPMIYDLDLDEFVEREILSNKTDVVYTRRNPKNLEEIWETSLQFMILSRENCILIENEITKENYISSSEPAEGQVSIWKEKFSLKRSEESVRDTIFFFSGLDFFDFSPFRDFKLFYSFNNKTEISISTGEKITIPDSLRMVFYNFSDTIQLEININNLNYKIVPAAWEIIEFSIPSKEVEKISILYKGEEADLSSQYKKISLNHIYYDDTLE